VAGALSAGGVRPREVVAIAAANSIEYLLVFLGALRAGVAVAPLPAALRPQQLGGLVADSGARLLFADAAVPELHLALPRIALTPDGQGKPLERWMARATASPLPVSIEPDWPFCIIYSSGTTGTPKGIVQSHGMRSAHVSRSDGHGYSPDAVLLVATPLCSNTSMSCMFPALARGATVVLSAPRFDPAGYLRLAERTRATHAMLVPVQYQRLMAHPDFDRHDLSSFVTKYCSSAPFAAGLKAEVVRRWPGALIEYYGMTEGGGACVLDAARHPHKLHTVGVPVPGTEIRLIDEHGREVPPGSAGEVVGWSPSMMTAYHNRPQDTREAEWHDAAGRRFIRTGDIGRFDEDGFLVLLDRRKDMIISGGFNIYPSDLEAVLREHPAVAEAAVVGVPSQEWGETPVAFVVPGPTAPEAAEVLSWANDRLGRTQRLADLRFVQALPRSELGKVLKRVLREEYASRE
jgi:acyl-CoA synthetase (AMP-forming)/AMP-acid ligase II